jgi:bla regulator protein blaR1
MKSLESLIPTHVAEAIGATLMHSLWQLAAVALVLIVGLALVPQRAARLRYWLALSSMGVMLVLPMATFGLLYEPAAATPSTITTGLTPAAYQMHGALVRPPATIVKSIGLIDQINVFFQENAYFLFGLWILGMAALTLRFLGSCWHIHRLRKQGTQEVPQDMASRFVDLLDQVGIRRYVGIRYSSLIDTPMVIGALKPIVLLPMGLLSGLTMEQVECILIHELGHVRRWDYLLNMLQSIAEIVLFYHPATWWVSGIIRQERENCCDELVVHLKSNKVQYARALLSLELLRQQPTALAMTSQGGDLASRIRRITGGPMPTKRRFHARGLLFGLITMGCVLLLATQSHTVVKAALPFFMDQTVKETATKPANTKVHTSTVLETSTGLSNSGTSAAGSLLNAMRLASLLGTLHFTSVAQDSPITKVTMTDNGEEVELRFNSAGRVMSGTRNGVEIPSKDLVGYQDMATTFFQRSATPGLPPLSPMPPMPSMGALGSMPVMPPMDTPGTPGFNEKTFERDMENFGKEMERWGEEFAKQFDGKDWEEYGAKMEQWGEQFGEQFARMAENMPTIDESPEYKELQSEMDELQEQLENAKGRRERDDLKEQIAIKADQMGEMQAAGMEEKMAGFEAQMEAWGERFAASMERAADLQQQRADEEAARADEEAARADEEAARADEDAARADEDAARADEDAARADEEAARAENASEVIGDALVSDGLVKNPNSFKLKINNEEFFVDGKKQSKSLHNKYSALIRETMGVKVSKDWVSIHHNSR